MNMPSSSQDFIGITQVSQDGTLSTFMSGKTKKNSKPWQQISVQVEVVIATHPLVGLKGLFNAA